MVSLTFNHDGEASFERRLKHLSATAGWLVAVALILGFSAAAAQDSGKQNTAVSPAPTVASTGGIVSVVNGMSIGSPPSATMLVALTDLPDAKLPSEPACAPKDPASFAGFLRFEQMPSAGTYQVTLSSEAWIDVIQNGAAVAPVTGGRTVGCADGRRSLRYDLGATPVVLQLTGAASDHIAVTVRQIAAPAPASEVHASIASASAVPPSTETAVVPPSPSVTASSGEAAGALASLGGGELVDQAPAPPSAQAHVESAAAAWQAAGPHPPPSPSAAVAEASAPASVAATQSAAVPSAEDGSATPTPLPAQTELPRLATRDIAPRPIHLPVEGSSQPSQAERPLASPVTGKGSARNGSERPSSVSPAQSPPRAVAMLPPPTATPPAQSAALPPAPSAALASDLVELLARRGDELLKQRDIAGARLLLERAALAGNSRAAMLAGKTYDPLYFAEIGVSGIAPDRSKAIEWYRTAVALGDRDAAARTQNLLASSQQ